MVNLDWPKPSRMMIMDFSTITADPQEAYFSVEKTVDIYEKTGMLPIQAPDTSIDWHIQMNKLMELHSQSKVTDEEKINIEKMLNSPDLENFTLASEIIKIKGNMTQETVKIKGDE